eukprot:CAMPEP_0181202470 /NCGR_PEP_ID=MMETSP1096-20121128/18860_1 /TAXON_ID=156174 ORGANISM="Chrysochromulina ericina, Strain CCMP281" /NCGR_SAMPLE_ID=MMETSP1096 /ASSEMBLY_ACC=CAM_ASM_000453 /LENGTH=72 /DNA_ID=CAMNT_0023292987 /DNA_START=398 /DNA_END=616 /DNA_ORIENTATION=-
MSRAQPEIKQLHGPKDGQGRRRVTPETLLVLLHGVCHDSARWPWAVGDFTHRIEDGKVQQRHMEEDVKGGCK